MVEAMTGREASRIETSEVLPVFPTFIWKTWLRGEVADSINAQILERLVRMNRGIGSLEPGRHWQSPQNLHRLKAFRELLACVDRATQSILAFLNVSYDRVEVTGCWANVNAPGTPHKLHSHPNNYLSGVYYVQTQAGADTINFHDPRIQTGIIRPPVNELGAQNADQVVVQVTPGMLVMFPAWLPHSVDPNRSDTARISVSFNLMFSSFTEKIAKPLW